MRISLIAPWQLFWWRARDHFYGEMVSPRDSLRHHILHLSRRITGQLTEFTERNDPITLDSLIFVSEQLYRCLNSYGEFDNADTVAEAITLLLSIQNEFDDISGHVDDCATVRNGRPGRPSCAVSEDQLINLFEIGFSATRIACMLGVSVRTIRRRMDDIGLRVSDFYSTMPDNELDIVVNEILVLFPNTGYRMMTGHLKRRGIRVQQYRIRDSLHRVAPTSIATRWHASIVRRVYNVRSPLALWHIDSNHKLIRYVYITSGS